MHHRNGHSPPRVVVAEDVLTGAGVLAADGRRGRAAGGRRLGLNEGFVLYKTPSVAALFESAGKGPGSPGGKRAHWRRITDSKKGEEEDDDFSWLDSETASGGD